MAGPVVAAALASGTGLASGNKSGIRQVEGGYPKVSMHTGRNLVAMLTEHMWPERSRASMPGWSRA